MNTGNNVALTALNQALELEIQGQRFYLEAAECTTDPKGAEMFRSLADDEVIHERILRRQLDALTQGEGWVPVLSMVEGLPEGIAEVTAEIENKSFDLYREMAGKIEDPNGKRMYEYLANAERGHFEQLMLNYEHLSTVGSWAE
jgi:rubrerythrin